MSFGSVTITAPRTASARLRRTVVLLVLLSVAMLAAPRAFAGSEDAAEGSSLTTYTVSAGDTLWDIASSLTPIGDDVSETVIQLQRINRMHDTTLLVGDQLYLPLTDEGPRG